MADKETGWTKEWPKVNGFYWTREHPHDSTPILVEVRRNRLTICGEALSRDVKEAFEASEFLGPVNASDFEQLAALRVAAQEARDVLALLVPYGKIHTVEGVRYPDGTHSEAVDRGERVLNELRRIVGKEWEDEPVAALREALGEPK